jgi:eukaryotic-like serine/threonine-protein kinase
MAGRSRLSAAEPAPDVGCAPGAPSPLPEPRAFDGYELRRLIGAGAMGQVFLAHDTLLDRPVAIKLIAATSADHEAKARFMQEARAVARLQHPNVVAIYRVGFVGDRPYLVAEYVRGRSLDQLPAPVPGPAARRIALQIACGLAAAHRKGVIHRDIKPANVIQAEDGSVKLLDFGVAKLLGDGPICDVERQAHPPATAARERPELATSATQMVDAPAAASCDLTAASGIMGTPLFMAPELWRGEPASFASDVYALGTLLYTICAGHPPHQADNLTDLGAQIQTEIAQPLAEAAPGLDAAFCGVVDRCLQRVPTERYASGNEVRAALDRLGPGGRAGPLPRDTPYRGLSVFEAEHSGLFFGRDSEVRMILDRLKSEPFVLVAGDSGVGKSSLCRAGVLPRVDGWLGPEGGWSTVCVVPGRHPVRALAAALAPLLGRDEASLISAIEADPAGVARSLRAGRAATGGGIVVFVDQLEELATLCSGEEAAVAAHLLGWLAEPAPGARLVAAVRGDFLSRLACLPRLGEALSRALYFLRPLSDERIREAITEPARLMGVDFESEALVAELGAAVSSDRGALPLLQFTLAELWQALPPGETTIARETLAGLGGVAGALSRHADQVLAQMRPAQRRAARDVLQRLLTAEGTRARRSEAELCGEDPTGCAALQALVHGRIVVAQDSAEGPAYEIAHETLVHDWSTLAGWLAEDADVQRQRRRLQAVAAEWERAGRRRDGLWSARQLAEANSLQGASLLAGERAFLAASRRSRRRALAIRVTLILAAPLIAAAVYAGVQIRAEHAHRQRVETLSVAASRALDRARDLRGQARALRRRALERFDRRKTAAGEQGWARFRARSATMQAAFRKASQRLETAILLEPGDVGLHHLFATALFERALLADAQRRKGERDELLQRMALYDRTGRLRRRWAAPARVELVLTPANAKVTLRRYVEGRRGRLQLRPTGSMESGATRRLPPGSYLAEVTAPGRARVRLPFMVGRGERARLVFTLPRAGQVPRGFVHVPPGRFLFGSAAQDGQRRSFLHTVPIHLVRTGAYLIARHETTYADWLAYLAALPPALRVVRAPQIAKGGFQGALSLTPLRGGGWRLALKPASRVHQARTGQTLVYPGRARRSRQDWLRLPVTGITAADAARYLRWLDRSGRVPGARLCTGHEWERAARGADDRAYPHGGALAADEANFDDTYGKRPEALGPDEVGSYPASRSPFGLDDLAGNVWEWVRSSVGPPGHVARGGSFHFGANSSRSTGREITDPSFKDISVGLRVCADPPAPKGSSPRR